MGFATYIINYLNKNLKEYESLYGTNAPYRTIHEAKVLLKMLDDIADEGYTYINKKVSLEIDGIKRLKKFIESNGDNPFPMYHYSIEQKPVYSESEIELNLYLLMLEQRCKDAVGLPGTPQFYYDLLSFVNDANSAFDCETSYVFLLRDTLLPYLAFRNLHKDSTIFPLLIGRKFLSFYSKDSNYHDDVYDRIHNAIFDALDNNPKGFSEFKKMVKENLKTLFKDYPNLVSDLMAILANIPREKIIVIESGYIGSIPMLLACLDDRVDFMLFSTVPFLYKVYEGKYYTNEFEKMRLFETIQAQDALFKLSSFQNGEFYITETVHKEIQNQSINEIKSWKQMLLRLSMAP